jgi:hypothetical protein
LLTPLRFIVRVIVVMDVLFVDAVAVLVAVLPLVASILICALGLLSSASGEAKD